MGVFGCEKITDIAEKNMLMESLKGSDGLRREN